MPAENTRRVRRAAAIAALGLCAYAAQAMAQSPSSAPAAGPAAADLERRVEALLAQLTQREKILLMSGGSSFGTAALPRVGVPALRFADGPTGVRSNNDEPATVFPTGTALAATWNDALVEEVGRAIGAEAKALDVQVLLGPNVNMHRTPLAGRNFEAYSEDPWLAGRIGAGFVRGVQSQGVGTSPKHFVGNEQELERLRGSSNIDERTLREIYLAPFEMIVKDAQPWTVMAAYNRLNGTYVTEDARLLRDVLKGQWGFDGVLMSDWGAVRSTAPAANAGTDLEMPGPPRRFGAQLFDAARSWQVEQPVIDEAARRMLRLVLRTKGTVAPVAGTPAAGAKPAAAPPLPRRDTGSARHAQIARRAAAEAITLLRNERGLLPLDATRTRRIAVIGPNADVPLQQGGGSSAVVPSRLGTPLAALRARAGNAVTIVAEPGVDNDLMAPPVDHRQLSTDAARTVPGLRYRYWAGDKLEGTPAYEGIETHFEKTMIGSEMHLMTARWEGFYWPERDGEHEFRLTAQGGGFLWLDGQFLIGDGNGTTLPQEADFGGTSTVARINLKAGRPYTLRIDYVGWVPGFHQLQFGVRQPPPSFDAAVAAARGADAAVVFVGVSRTSESEGRDRRDMALPGRQDALVEAVLAANPNTIVVLNNGGPLALPWAERVPALVEAWLPGQEGPEALAAVLFGDENPAGRLPITFPRRIEDTPTWLHYSAGRDANYGEGVFVGYRYYDRRKVEPLFAFGHGLSYTRFEYANLRVPANASGGPVEVSVDVRNAGSRAGSEVVQLYVGDRATTDVVRPPKELRRFARITLAPGETRTVRFTLGARDLAYWDVHVGDWVATPGEHVIAVGASSADLRLQQPLRWTAPRDPRLPAPVGSSLNEAF